MLQVYADSPASEAGLSRGDRIAQRQRHEASPRMVTNGTDCGAFGAADIGVTTSD